MIIFLVISLIVIAIVVWNKEKYLCYKTMKKSDYNDFEQAWRIRVWAIREVKKDQVNKWLGKIGVQYRWR